MSLDLGRVLRHTNRPLGVAAGLVLDRLVREPPDQVHPVAIFGSAMTRLEEAIWADDRRRGAMYAVVGVTGAGIVGARARSLSSVVSVVVAGTELRRIAGGIAARLERDDLVGARQALPALVGRDPSALDATDISAAVIESVAENMVDAVIAPAFWGLVAGSPGAAAYRAVNTMDAMVGHRSTRFENFGWAAAKLDDAANYLPARIFAALIVVQRIDRRADMVATIRRDAPAHPSPNAGVAETAMAAAIERELGGPLRYGDRAEERPRLGDGPRPSSADVADAIRLADRAEWIFTLLAAAVGVARLGRRLTRR